jgi:peptide deformylase
MALLKIVTWPDPLLKEVSKPVVKVGTKEQKLMDDMYETMLHENGIGLAAVQVGVLKRILVIEIKPNERYQDLAPLPDEQNKKFCFVNPKIIKQSKAIITFREGCLSFPNQFAEVARYATITVNYLDYHGKTQTLEAVGILAICLQHEIDHLNGIRFIDHLSKIKRDMVLKKLKKAQKHADN